MLSRDDYAKYLDQMNAIEAHMTDVYSQCIPLAEDEELKKALIALLEAEKAHAHLVVSLKELFS